MKINGLKSLFDAYVEENGITQEVLSHELDISLSKFKAIRSQEEVHKIDDLGKIYDKFGKSFKDLVDNTPNGQKINELVLDPKIGYVSALTEKQILLELLVEAKQQTRLLARIQPRVEENQ